MIWNKFKSQFITLLVSIILIAVIFSIYEDLHKVLKISNKDSVFGLLLLKWFLITLIFGFNWYKFHKLKPISTKNTKIYSNNDNNKSHNIVTTKQHQHILKKKKLKTKTDVILQKYIGK